MKKIFAAAVIALWCAPSAALANERVGSAAIGALAGAVVLGPVGAVAGAAIGFAAGPAIANSWGVTRSEPQRPETAAKSSRKTSAKHVPLPQAKPAAAAEARAAAAVPPAATQAPGKDTAAPAKPAAQTDASARLVPH